MHRQRLRGITIEALEIPAQLREAWVQDVGRM
jgi:hypothetical protein